MLSTAPMAAYRHNFGLGSPSRVQTGSNFSSPYSSPFSSPKRSLRNSPKHSPNSFTRRYIHGPPSTYDEMDDNELFDELSKYEGVAEFQAEFRKLLTFVETNLQSTTASSVNQVQRIHEDDQDQREILRADDKLEDGREAIPNIKSLRSRFESSEGGKSGGDWRSSANGERSSTISSSSRASRWDKPKGDVPAPINRKSDDEELDGPEDLPQPSHTRNMLAKFKQIEGEPGQVQQQTVTTVKKTSSVSTRNARPSPDSGIYETESYTNGQNGHSKEREVDTEELPGSGFTKNLVAQWRNKEQESGLKSPSPSTNKNPVRSFSARSTSQRSVTPDRNSDRNSDRVSDRTSERHISESNDFNVSEHDDYMDSPRSDVVRETDRHDEDELPPPSFTRNMLAKFQSMQEEAAQREATTVKPVSKKQFKWQVKESITLKGPSAAPNDFNRRAEYLAI